MWHEQGLLWANEASVRDGKGKGKREKGQAFDLALTTKREKGQAFDLALTTKAKA